MRKSSVFGFTSVALCVAGLFVLFASAPGGVSYRDLGVLFSGGCFASAWIAFQYYRTGENDENSLPQ